jgi:hypothetical protein
MTRSLTIEPSLRFDDDTDLEQLGICAEELTWRLPANLPRKPIGLSLISPQYDVSALLAQLDAEQYAPSWRLFGVPCLGLLMLVACVALVAIRLPTFWLLLPVALGLLVFVWSCIDLQQHRLIIDMHGIHYGVPHRLPEYSVPWLALVGVTLSEGLVGPTLLIMHRQGPDASLSLTGIRHAQLAFIQIQQFQHELKGLTPPHQARDAA